MGCIISISEAIDATRFTNLKKGKVYSGCEITILDRADGGTGPDVALVKMPDGQLTVLGSRHSPNGNWAVMGYGVSRFDKSVLSAMVKIGAVSQGDIDDHIASAQRRKDEMDKKHAVESLKNACSALGIPVPAIP